MLVTNYDEADAAPELVVFDTLITQDHPKSFRQFSTVGKVSTDRQSKKFSSTC